VGCQASCMYNRPSHGQIQPYPLKYLYLQPLRKDYRRQCSTKSRHPNTACYMFRSSPARDLITPTVTRTRANCTAKHFTPFRPSFLSYVCFLLFLCLPLSPLSQVLSSVVERMMRPRMPARQREREREREREN